MSLKISRRYLRMFCALALSAGVLAPPHTALAQSPDKTPAAQPKKAEPPAKTPPAVSRPAAPQAPQAGLPPAPQAVLPSAEIILVLVRSTLLRLNDALLTGNYTVMRDLAAPSFAQANSAGRLYQIFANLSSQGVDLSAVAILAPQLPQTPAIDPNGRLRIAGYFPGQPVQINFEMLFEAVDRRWRIFALSVSPSQSISSASTAPPSGSASGAKRSQ